MKNENPIALKEWVALGQALREGWQVVMIKPGDFRPPEKEFFLYPLYEMVDPALLGPRFKSWPAQAVKMRPSDGRVNLSVYLTVDSVLTVTDPRKIKSLAALTIWSDALAGGKGPWQVLTVRCYRKPRPVELDPGLEEPVSGDWIRFKKPVPTAGFFPVFSAEVFEDKKQAALAAMADAS
ncbi:MAG TPA: DUF1802 family protein [Elusimicrobiota bacterium]|nr:DUF1802 family protein [Elusimicrobiota bacterium]